MRGPTNDTQDAPDLDAGTTTGDARTKKANGVRAGRPHPAANHRQVVRPSCLPRVASQDDRSRPRDQVAPPPAEWAGIPFTPCTAAVQGDSPVSYRVGRHVPSCPEAVEAWLERQADNRE
jgi:hypothetical protein